MFSKLVALTLLTAARATLEDGSEANAAVVCEAIDVRVTDAWCNSNCNHAGAQFCPPTYCRCQQVATTVSVSDTSAALVKTTFTAQLVLQSAADVDPVEYRDALASISGAEFDNIQIQSVTFRVQAQYKFAEAITEADVEAAVHRALMNYTDNLASDKVSAKISGRNLARRLRTEKETRRLSETVVDVTVGPTGSTVGTNGLDVAKSGATGALVGLNDTAALAAELGVSGPELVSSAVRVTVATEMLSSANGADLALGASAALAQMLDAEVSITSSAPPNTTDSLEQSAAARKEVVVVTPLVLLALASSDLLL